eukprot:g47508.t1
MPRVLKEIAEEIDEALLAIFQESLEASLFKVGRQKTGNYRPVSLTSVTGNILESIVWDELMEYLNVHDKIGLSEHSLVKGRSCLTNPSGFFEEVMSKVNKGQLVHVIYLDFHKAFENVPHRWLLNKTRVHDIRGK